MVYEIGQPRTTEADVLVVGIGVAGLAAAITAHDTGAEVVVLEKMPPEHAGGNSRVSAQVWFSPTDTEAAKTYLRAMSGEHPVPERIVATWAAETARNDEWLRARAEEVRGLVPWDDGDPYTGDGTDFLRLSWGDMLTFQGVVDPPAAEYPEVPGNECGTEYNVIAGSMGFSRLWLMLKTCLDRRRIPVEYATRVTRLVHTVTGEIAGVAVEDAHGHGRTIEARKGVVLATGGFANNQEMVRNYLRLSHGTPWGSPACTGDGIRMAQKVGADLAHPYNYVAEPGIAMPPYEAGERAQPQDSRFIYVGADGSRFTDETAAPRHGKARLRGRFDFHPDGPMWTVFDENGRLAGPLVPPRDMYAVGWMKAIERYEWSADNSREIDRGWIVRADTLDELARALEIDADGLVREVARYNEWATAGTDDPVHGRPAGTMFPIDRPPFYGFRWAQLLTTTLGGIRKDHQARALDPDGLPIPRLFCAGDVASTYSWCLSGGMAIGDAIAFGRVAGRSAAAVEDPAEVVPIRRRQSDHPRTVPSQGIPLMLVRES